MRRRVGYRRLRLGRLGFWRRIAHHGGRELNVVFGFTHGDRAHAFQALLLGERLTDVVHRACGDAAADRGGGLLRRRSQRARAWQVGRAAASPSGSDLGYRSSGRNSISASQRCAFPAPSATVQQVRT
jgi:hypothetical protein